MELLCLLSVYLPFPRIWSSIRLSVSCGTVVSICFVEVSVQLACLLIVVIVMKVLLGGIVYVATLSF